jgi:cytochrome P450
MQPHVEPPVAEGHWFWGSLLERRRDPLKLFFEAHDRLGETVRFRMGPMIDVLSLTNPDHVKHVLIDAAHKYHKGAGLERARPLLGDGLLTSEGSHWMRQRRLMQPAFHKDRIAGFARTMITETEELVSRWEPTLGQPFDVNEEMMKLALTIVARTLFSTEVAGEAERVGRALTVAMEEANRRMLSYFVTPGFVPTRRNRAFREAIGTLDSIIFQIIAERRAGKTRGDDLLAMLLEAKDADTGEQMNDRQLRDEVMTLFLAGHETTANALSWLWYFLAQHPEVEAKLHHELDAQLAGRAATADDVPKLRYLNWTLQETMRLHPPAWILARQALEEDAIDGLRIRPSRLLFVMMSPLLIHRNPRLWRGPERFDPERFSPENTAGRPKLAYLPFGAGQRLCIGHTFAMMEASLAAAIIARSFRLTLVADQRVELEPLITLRPRHGIRMLAQRRMPPPRA